MNSNPSTAGVAALIHSRAAIRERETTRRLNIAKRRWITRSDIDRSSSGGTWRNDCSEAVGMKISEADAHNRDQGTKKKKEERTIRRCAHSRASDTYEKETVRASGNRSRISETGRKPLARSTANICPPHFSTSNVCALLHEKWRRWQFQNWRANRSSQELIMKFISSYLLQIFTTALIPRSITFCCEIIRFPFF